MTFNLANCAESNERTAEAVRLLERYLEISPKALDAGESLSRIADLNSLLALPGPNGAQVRRLYAAAYGGLSERKYDRALTSFTKASDLTPEFALTKWKLGLLYEAPGDVDQRKENFAHFQELSPEQGAKDEAALHLTTSGRETDQVRRRNRPDRKLSSDLFNRAMNLTFNGSESRSALEPSAPGPRRRAMRRKQAIASAASPYPTPTRSSSCRAPAEHLQIALALFPLGAEANELPWAWFSCRPTTAHRPSGTLMWWPARACRFRFTRNCAAASRIVRSSAS